MDDKIRTELEAAVYRRLVEHLRGRTDVQNIDMMNLAGFFVLGIQSGINVIGALIYPTSLRANGSGWELGIGRIGSIAGPLVGALLIGLPVERLYMWSALPFVVGAVVCFIVYRLNAARLAARPELRDAQ